MKEAVFIIPYFGKLPSYIHMWAKTAGKNLQFDFWLITDDKSVELQESNIRTIYMPFEEFVEKAQSKFDFKIGLNSPRKLCDFKPTYGYIFEEEIKNYKYWGYCDIDVILGDLNKLIPLDEEYDKLFVHGHMTLIKNIHEMNTLFMKAVDFPETYIDVLSDPKNHIFDEPSNGLNINLIAKKEKINTYIDYKIADINPYKYLFNRSLYDYSVPNINRKVEREDIQRQIFYWENGSLFRYYIKEGNSVEKEEFRYFHFQKRDIEILDIDNANAFVIAPNKVFAYEGKITRDFIEKNTKKRLIYPKYYSLKWNNLKKKLRR